MNTYNPDSMVDRRALAISLQQMLAGAGFKQSAESTGADIEEVYARDVPEVPGTRIVVFSSISRGAARPNGSDAIRVAILYQRKDGREQFLLSETRVNRAGSIESITQRTLDRMRDAFITFRNRQRSGLYCKKCAAPFFTSRQGYEVCAETCWVS